MYCIKLKLLVDHIVMMNVTNHHKHHFVCTAFVTVHKFHHDMIDLAIPDFL